MAWALYLEIEGLLANALTVTGPAVVVEAGAVLDTDKDAKKAGIRPGMSVRSGRLLCQEACFVSREDAKSHASYVSWLHACHDLAGAVEPVPPKAVFLSCPGSKAPTGWAQQVLKASVPHHGHAIWAGLATTKFLARAAAQPGKLVTVQPQDAKSFAGALAPAALWPLPKAAIKKLESLGITRLKQLQDASPAALSPYLGGESRRILALARGEDPSSVLASFPPRSMSSHRHFDSPVSDAAVLTHALEDALKDACAHFRLGEAAKTLDIRLSQTLGPAISVQRRFSSPRTPASLRFGARRLLEQASSQAISAIDDVEVVIEDIAQVTPWQETLFGSARRPGIRQTLESLSTMFQKDILKAASDLPKNRMEALMAYFDPLRQEGAT